MDCGHDAFLESEQTFNARAGLLVYFRVYFRVYCRFARSRRERQWPSSKKSRSLFLWASFIEYASIGRLHWLSTGGGAVQAWSPAGVRAQVRVVTPVPQAQEIRGCAAIRVTPAIADGRHAR